MWLYSSARYSVYLVRMSWASVSQFPFLPCMVLACPCFVLVKTFNSWYAFSLTFFLMLPTIPWQCRSIQDSFFPPFSWSSCFLGLLFELFLTPFRCPMSSLLRCPLLVTNIQYVSCDPRFFDCSAFANDLASFSVIAVLKGSSTSRMVTGAYYAYQYNYYVGLSVLLTRFWADFTSSLWNFSRWGADSHETSLALRTTVLCSA